MQKILEDHRPCAFVVRLIGKLHDLAVLDIDVLMLCLGIVSDDDMDVIDKILALFVLFRTGEKFDQQKSNNSGSENNLNESDQRDPKYVRQITPYCFTHASAPFNKYVLLNFTS